MMIPNPHHITSPPTSPRETSTLQMPPFPHTEPSRLYHHPVLQLTTISYDFKDSTSPYHERSSLLSSSTTSRPSTPRLRQRSAAQIFRSLFVALGILLLWIILVQAIRPLVFGGTPVWERTPSVRNQESTPLSGERFPTWDARSRSHTTPAVVKPSFGISTPPTLTWTTTTTVVAETTTVIIAPGVETKRNFRQPIIAFR